MSSAVRNIFSLIFVSKKQKLKISQGGEAPAEGTDAPHLYMIATRSCRLRHRTFLSQVVTSAFEMVSTEVSALLYSIKLSCSLTPWSCA